MAEPKSLNDKRRIAVIGPFPPIRSGVARHTESIARTLDQRDDLTVKRWGFRRQYPSWLYPGENERDPEARDTPRNVEETMDGDNPLSWRRTVRQIADWGPDLVVAPAWTFALAPSLGFVSRRLSARGVEQCIVVHNAYDHEATGWKNRLSDWQLGAADRFVTHNHALSEEIARRFPGKPLSIFPHPTFDDLPAAKGNLKRRFDIELLFFGLVRPHKGVDLLLDAMAQVNRTNIGLTIAGEFWGGLEETRARLARLGQGAAIELIPRFVSDDEAAELFERADAVVLPYRAVSGSGVVSSAYHYGKPVIASDLPGFAEVVRHGETGWLFEPDSVGDLAATIARLDPSEVTDAGNKAKALGQKLSWDRFADVVLGLPLATEPNS